MVSALFNWVVFLKRKPIVEGGGGSARVASRSSLRVPAIRAVGELWSPAPTVTTPTAVEKFRLGSPLTAAGGGEVGAGPPSSRENTPFPALNPKCPVSAQRPRL